MNKRIVLVHTAGAYKGLWMIVGTDDQLREQMAVTDLPEFVSPVRFLDHEGGCSLVSVRKHYILYRELMAPDTSTFHPDQQ